MENIIKKAIEGGYEPKYEKTTVLNSVIYFCDDGSILATGENGKILEIYDKAKIVLDPLFWQSLGKACGWKYAESIDREGRLNGDWINHAQEFHYINLTQSWDEAVKWLEDLISK